MFVAEEQFPGAPWAELLSLIAQIIGGLIAGSILLMALLFAVGLVCQVVEWADRRRTTHLSH